MPPDPLPCHETLALTESPPPIFHEVSATGCAHKFQALLKPGYDLYNYTDEMICLTLASLL